MEGRIGGYVVGVSIMYVVKKGTGKKRAVRAVGTQKAVEVRIVIRY